MFKHLIKDVLECGHSANKPLRRWY